jgi:phosphoglycolate phosphatase-like HAD superfamily hydrolase
MLPLDSYATIIFDCDGVILNSNKPVSKCFFNTVIEYGEDKALELEQYNKLNGGISRNKKLKYFFETILEEKNYDQPYQKALKKFSELSFKSRINCEISKYLIKDNFKDHQRYMVISGANEIELKKVLKLRGIKSFFNYGIFGSPKSKEQIMSKKIKDETILFPALYIGDSKYDHKVSKLYGLDFVFIYGWTEFSDWPEYCKNHNIIFYNSLDSMFK